MKTYFAALVIPLLFTPQVYAFTLLEAVESALQKNPDISVVTLNRHAVDEEHKQARAGYFPKIDIDSSYGYQRTNNSSTRNRDSRNTGDGPYRGLWQADSEITVNQMLFDGFDTKNESKRQYYRRKSASYRVFETVEFTAMNTIRAYMDVLKFTHLVDLGAKNVKTNKGYLAQMNERLKFKSGSMADVQQVQSRLSLALARQSAALNSLSDARAEYYRVVGIKPSELDKQNLPEAPLPEALTTAIETAIQTHPAIKITQNDVVVAEALAKRQKADLYPTLDFELGANTNKNTDGTRNYDSEYNALINLSYNLYNGGEDLARYREHLKRLDEAKEAHRQTLQDVERNLTLSWERFIHAKDRNQHFTNQEKAATQVLEAYQDQFRVGRRTLLDLLDSENELFTARVSQTNAYYNMLNNYYQIMTDTGQLLSHLELAPPAEAIAP